MKLDTTLFPILSEDPAERKAKPVATGALGYFPRALLGVAGVSQKGNDQHNPGQPMHWDRSKSQDQLDAAARHLLEVLASDDPYGEETLYKLSQCAWRILAESELRHEKAAQVRRRTCSTDGSTNFVPNYTVVDGPGEAQTSCMFTGPILADMNYVLSTGEVAQARHLSTDAGVERWRVGYHWFYQSGGQIAYPAKPSVWIVQEPQRAK